MLKAGLTDRMLLSGNEAVAYGAYAAGVKVACAYPGTPSTEILETLAKLPDVDAQWSVNEKAAYEVALGAAMGGVRGLFACKHVGLNVAMDPLMTSAYTGVNAGLVAVVCDDPGMHSSQNEQDTRWASIYAKVPLIEPASPAEAGEYVEEAFKISERFDTPVLVRMTTRVSHIKEDVVVRPRKVPARRAFGPDIRKYVMVPGNAYPRHIVVEKRLVRLAAFAEKCKLTRVEMNDRRIGFITSGPAYNYLKERYPDASYLKLGFVYPFCDEKIRKFAASVKKVIVIEELDPFIEQHVRAMGIRTAAKDRSFRVGELRPELIEAAVKGEVKREKKQSGRKPRMCANCPHWFTFSVLRKLGLYVAGDIGCYTLAAMPPTSALHTCICMGSGVTLPEGMYKAQPDERIVGVVGDSTFVHSGITGLINAVYNKSKGVIFILDNSTTAMTGGQHHPATGFTIRDEPTHKLNLEMLCLSCGADNVDVADPKNKEEFESLVRKRLAGEGLSVIIARHPCQLAKK